MPIRGALVLWLACLGPALADEVVLKNGSSFEGRIVEETDDSVSIDVGAGVMKFEKSSVARIARDAGATPPAGDEATQPPAGDEGPAPAGRGDIPQALEGDLVANVGPGGVTRKQLADRVYGYTRGDSTLEDLSDEEALAYLDPLVDDELLFQGAIADGAFDEAAVRARLVDAQLQSQGVETSLVRIHRGLTEEELRAWYQAHQAELAQPSRIGVRGVVLLDSVDVPETWEEVGYTAKAEKARTASPDDPFWSCSGWIEKGGGDFGPRAYEFMRDLAEGDVSTPILCNDNKWYFFRVEQREGLATPKYEECVDRVRMRAAAEKAKGPEGARTEELFRAALDAGLHRNSYHRAFIVETYVTKRKASRADLLKEMRERFPVTVRLGE